MQHKPGIYFNMPEQEYHADPSLSTSGIKLLLQDPEEYWDPNIRIRPIPNSHFNQSTLAASFSELAVF